MADATAITALVQCLVASLARRWDAGERLAVHDAYRINENAWRGLRYGVRGTLVDLGYSDCHLARTAWNAVAYGFIPFRHADPLVNLTTKHGVDEHILIADLAFQMECARSLALAQPG